MSWWPFRKSVAETESEQAFKRMLAESRVRTDDLAAVAAKLRENRERMHRRAQQLLGDPNGIKTFKSSPG